MGGQRVIFLAAIGWSLITFWMPELLVLTPRQWYYTIPFIVTVRILMGALQGVHFPSMISITSQVFLLEFCVYVMNGRAKLNDMQKLKRISIQFSIVQNGFSWNYGNVSSENCWEMFHWKNCWKFLHLVSHWKKNVFPFHSENTKLFPIQFQLFCNQHFL